jgi:tRNA A37 threonylcarbamoyladenosine dehydratase
MDRFLRTSLLLSKEKMDSLKQAHVMVFGVGGVGGYVVEALVRSGVGKISIIDNDTVNLTNLNRQIIALESTLDKLKVEVLKERILAINPQCDVMCYNKFITNDNIDEIDFNGVSYVVDAVDTITAKIAIIEKAKTLNIPVISSMGAGNRLDPMQIKIGDINQTKNCPLAKVMRNELKKRNIKGVKCIYSLELPVTPNETIVNLENGKKVIGSIAYMPSIFGLIIASEVIKDL